MKVIRMVITIIDFENLGAEGAADVLKNTRYPNDCINLSVRSFEERDIGEWHDDHPLNRSDTEDQEYERIFGGKNK